MSCFRATLTTVKNRSNYLLIKKKKIEKQAFNTLFVLQSSDAVRLASFRLGYLYRCPIRLIYSARRVSATAWRRLGLSILASLAMTGSVLGSSYVMVNRGCAISMAVYRGSSCVADIIFLRDVTWIQPRIDGIELRGLMLGHLDTNTTTDIPE